VIDRRTFVSGITLGLLAAPLAVEAEQSGHVPRVGLLSDESVSGSSAPFSFGALSNALRDLGWVDGQTFTFERRYAEGNNAFLPGLATELVRLNMDIIVTIGTSATLAAKRATETIPIVFARVGDPVGVGLVKSLSRPGGNLSGVTIISKELGAKRLELLKEAVPNVSRVGVLWDPSFSTGAAELKEIESAARSLGVGLQVMGVRHPEEFERAILAMTKQHVGALIVTPSLIFTEHRKRLADLSAKARVPMMSVRREIVETGGLMSYGPNFSNMYQRAAIYVDKILKGAKPADLPVEQPEKFELVINLKTAKALGLTIPQSLLLRADQVIE
jgi:putative ABC transport system substrate-binding protein